MEVHRARPKAPAARPHVREFLADSLTPLAVYRRLAALSPIRFLFESVSAAESISRYSFLGAAPWGVYRLFSDRLELKREGRTVQLDGPPLERLREVTGSIGAVDSSLPFTGGFVGYFGYDFVRHLERLPRHPDRATVLPDALLARFDSLVIFDHARQRVLAVANEIQGQVDRRQAEARLDRLTELLTARAEESAVEVPGHSGTTLDAPECLFTADAFKAAVGRAKSHISAGDIFQVVLARRWRLPVDLEPLAVYRALRTVNPSPYMVLFETPAVSLVGASPEMLVRKKGTRLETRPIAGTRPRSSDAAVDRRLACELLEDPKERAEHVMLVDLGRNDLGRIGRPGSVRTPSFMQIERYSHVMHLVSGVEAEIAPEWTAIDALQACFPAGTVTGAPKIRAMQIIDELEPEARGPYAGAVGYLSYNGDMDTCITIRTLVLRPGEVSITAGAGIVADSDPDREVEETESKAAGTLAALDLATRLASTGSERA